MHSHIPTLADRYRAAVGGERGNADATLSTKIWNQARVIGGLRSGSISITLRLYEQGVRWFRDHWPEGAEWPEGIPVPQKSEGEAA